MTTWIWKEPLPGTTLFPHHRRWATRLAMISALQSLPDELCRARCFVARARAFNCIMFDCCDPMASRYAMRLDRIEALIDKETA